MNHSLWLEAPAPALKGATLARYFEAVLLFRLQPIIEFMTRREATSLCDGIGCGRNPGEAINCGAQYTF